MLMALTISNGGGRCLYVNPSTSRDPLRHQLFPTSIGTRTPNLLVVSAAKKLSSRTGRFDSKNRRSGSASTAEEERRYENEIPEEESVLNGVALEDGLGLPGLDLPGEKPDFWEGPQWDAFGFFMQYMWAFGIVFALIACGIAVVTYNEGATDFKETPAYKESVQSRELLEGPEASDSDSDVFESNPTEVAPTLD